MRLRFLQTGLALIAFVAAGCGSYLRPFELERARPAQPTAAALSLRDLPAPREQVVVAVYRFRDQTGQYRTLENASTFSTAVTQGATSILVRALDESGWFRPIEREALPNLLNERQIISQIRSQNAGPDGAPLPPLPPLLYAGILLEGGIIGYDSNIITSGIGVRYFGAGASGQVRRDQVTVYLRAISTQTGRVLRTVHTTKTILSQQTEGGLFRYVSLRHLLEAEAGYSFNEPPALAVTEAIEEAVRGLIIEGVRENLWALRTPSDSTGAAFAAYDRAVAESESTDAFGRAQPGSAARGGFSVGASLAATLYEGDYRDPVAAPSVQAFVRQRVTPRLGLGIAASIGQIAASGAFRTLHGTAEANGTYTLLPGARTTPFLVAGAGVLVQNDRFDNAGMVFPYLTGAIGIERLVSPSLRLGMSLGNVYPLREGLDGVRSGSVNDNFFLLRTHLVYRR
ncbi:MAG TPA: CsgG/HfaB family protein [Rubricoccaceae bacterium]